MNAVEEDAGGDGKIEFLADGSADFAKAIDLTAGRVRATASASARSAIRCWSRTAW